MEKDVLALFWENKALVPYTITRMQINLPKGMERNDLFQFGYLGLLEASHKYESGTGNFGTYACYRIRGSILDGVYAFQILSRRHFQNANLYLNAVEELKQRAEGNVTCEEVSEYLGVDGEVAARMELLAHRMVANEENKNRPKPEHCAVESRAYDAVVDRVDLMNAMKNLEPEERMVIEWKFYMDRTYKELENLTGIGKNRLHRICERAIEKLREAMEVE